MPLYLWGGDIGYFEKNSVHRFMSSAGVELIFWMDDKGTMRIGYDELPRSEWVGLLYRFSCYKSPDDTSSWSCLFTSAINQ